MRAATTTLDASQLSLCAADLSNASVLHFSPQRDRLIMEQLFEATSMVLCILDPAMRIVMANDAMASILVAGAEKIVGRSLLDFIPGSQSLIEEYFSLARRGAPLPDRQLAWNGRYYHLSFGVTRNHEGVVAELFVAALDVTRRAKIESELRDSRRRLIATSLRDHLTGLLNRRGLETALHRELRRARREGKVLSLLAVDIDWFKAYNDNFGHPEGDKCLRAIAGALHSCLRRAGDAAGRCGGEEFILILPNTDANGAAAIAHNCQRAIEGLGIVHPGSVYGRITVSIGISANKPSILGVAIANEAATLLSAADRALYRAKETGRDRIEFYSGL